MKNFLLTSITLSFLAAGLFAQENEAPSIAISLYAFEHTKEYQTIYLETPKETPYKIALSKANILGPFKTVKDEDGNVTLRKRETNAEGIVVYPALAKIRIPAQIKEPLLILVPVPGAQVYKAFVMDRSLSGFPKGSYKLINFSPNQVRGLIGKTRVNVPPKKLIPFNPSSNSKDLLDVHFQFKNSKQWKTFGRTRWVKEREKRSLLCAYLDPKTKRMRIRGVSLQSIRPLRDRVKPTSNQ